MPNVFYRATGLPDWVQIASRLQSRLDWTPVYWLGLEETRADVERTFPDVEYQIVYDGDRAEFPSDGVNPDYEPLDAEIIETFANYRPHALRMLDRMDPGHTFSYDERMRHYHKQLRYWRHTIDDHDVDLAVFVGWPHVISDFVSYAVCTERDDVDVLVSNGRANVPELCFLHESMLEPHRHLAELYSNRDELDPADLSETSKQYVDSLRTDDQTHSVLPSSGGPETIIGIPDLPKVFNVAKWQTYYENLSETAWRNVKVRNKPIEDSEISGARLEYHKKREERHKRKLKAAYNEHAVEPDPAEDFVFLPLHFEIEPATVPRGGAFSDQFLVVDALSKTMPDGWTLYVKEHPSQHVRYKISRSRHVYEYKDIVSLENTKLVETSTPSHDLIDNSEATATVTGTAGWEAVVRGTPAIVFGNAWYRLCDGVHYVETAGELQAVFDAIQDGERPEEDAVLQFVRAMEIAGYRGYNNSNQRADVTLSSTENVSNTVTAIEAHVSKSESTVNRESVREPQSF